MYTNRGKIMTEKTWVFKKDEIFGEPDENGCVTMQIPKEISETRRKKKMSMEVDRTSKWTIMKATTRLNNSVALE